MSPDPSSPPSAGARTTPARPQPAIWLTPLGIGAVVAVALGAYGRVHAPTYQPIITFGFSAMLPMKAWLTSAALLFGAVQVGTALAMAGRFPGVRSRPTWLVPMHYWSGRTAFLLTVPVGFHCLYALGLQSPGARVIAHGVVGCLFYGAFTTKMLLIEGRRATGWMIAVAGGVVFAGLVELWLTSSLWFFTTIGV
jgi:uncharacterized protein DUF6529